MPETTYPDVLNALIDQIAGKLQNKAVTDISGPYLHGPGGMFGTPGLERNVISTRVQPKGLLGRLPSRGTTRVEPLFPYISGFLAATGSVADGVCDDPQTAGPTKTCIQTAQFGRYSYQTRPFEINAVGLQTNRGEFLDLDLVNPIISSTGNSIEAPGTMPGFSFNNEVRMRTTEVGVAFQNVLTRQLYTGNPTNNSGGGGYKEFPGLDILIGTTKVDALTGTPCPSLRSDIKDFNYLEVNNNGGQTIVNVLTYMMRMLQWNAERMNFGDVTWDIVMRPQLFNELTAVWPCAYMTYRCEVQPNTQTSLVVNSNDQLAMRDDMRNGRYLIIDGIRYPVVLDDGIVEENRNDNGAIPITGFASDIYVVPRTIRNGTMAATFVEYLDYQADNGLMQSLAALGGSFGDTFYWTDGGRYAWHRKPPVNWCLQWLAKVEPRVILLTPHLAGRVTNVSYNPLQHERDSIIGDNYFVDGGVENRPGGLLYSDWHSDSPA